MNKTKNTIFTSGVLADSALGSTSGHSLAQQLAGFINTPNTTVYDKAIDSIYLSTHTGGSQLHHLVDGQHDIFGAFDAAAKALPNDSLWQEMMGTAHHLGKDLFSVSGLPVVSLDPGQYQSASTWLNTNLHIPKGWLGDLLQINGLELFSGILSVAAVVLGCKEGDAIKLSELAAASGLAGMLTANPIGMCAAAIALVMAWKQKNNSSDLRKGLLIGSGTAGATLAIGSGAAAILGPGMLPAIGGILLSLVVGFYVRRFLVNRLSPNTAPDTPPQKTLDWQIPELTPVEYDVWRTMLSNKCSMSTPVRQMIRDAIRK